MPRKEFSIKVVSFFLPLLFLSITTQATAKSVKRLTAQKIKDISVSVNDPQGQTWDGNHLWLADDDTDTIYKIDPSNGNIMQSIPSPGSQPRGLAWDGKNLWCSDSKTEKIYKLDTKEGCVISSIDAPVSKAANAPPDSVRGLAWDGKYLWSAYFAGYSSKICRIDPETGIVDKSFFPGGIPQELSCDGKYLYCVNNNNYLKKDNYDKYNFIKCFNLSDTLLTSLIKISSVQPRGLAFDGDNFWLIDKEAKKISNVKI